jgi:DNA-binding NtrC family response regulator
MTMLPQNEVQRPYAEDVFTGDSPAVQRLRLQVGRIAPHFRVALLTGESGVGKHTVAYEMHRASPVASLPFTVMPSVEFAQLPRSAACGTLYLPGLESLPPSLQGRFLRTLRSLDRETRVVVASQSDLKGMVAAGKLRQDLYEAVGTLEIRLAALRARLEDLEPIAHAMLRRLARSTIAFGAEASLRLRSYAWPGNLEELWALCEKLRPTATVVTGLDLPPLHSMAPAATNTARLEEVMHRHVMDVLQSCSGNKLRAAELLGISRSTLYRMLDSQTADPA